MALGGLPYPLALGGTVGLALAAGWGIWRRSLPSVVRAGELSANIGHFAGREKRKRNIFLNKGIGVKE